MTEEIRQTLAIIPRKPGCYQFYDENSSVIYVGKAKDLKKRVSSYFDREHDSPKTRILVRKIHKIKYIVVNSEEDTFLLENNLIKELQPRYNVQLKDDKSYPFIAVTNEPYPRVFKTRNVEKTVSTSRVNSVSYFGPYTSVQSVKALLDIVRKVYHIRTCRLKLTSEDIKAGKFKVCLEYHIKRCKGPCEGLQSSKEYGKNVDEVVEILKGNVSIIEKKVRSKMETLAEQLRFEEANEMKEKLQLIGSFREKSMVVSNVNYNLDVFSLEESEASAFVNYLHVVNGSVIQAYTFEYKKRLDETPEELLGMGIVEMRQRFGSEMKEIVVPFNPELKMEGVRFTVPIKGEKRKLLALSEMNVKQYKVDRLKRAEMLNPEQRTTRILSMAKKDLRLREIPLHIECFDNSNIQGSSPVAACVVFKKGKPSKKEYRHYNIKSVAGPDDYASMREVVLRRYSRLLKEGNPLPQLIVIDGGKGQLNAAVEALKKVGLDGKIATIGIAERLEEIYYPNDSVPLYIDKNSETLKLIQRLRDEAHRFGLSFHRRQRSNQQLVSELDGVKGIGPVTKNKLLTHFKSIKRLKEADQKEIVSIIGPSKGNIIREWIDESKGKSV
jgi:excinuclease ABC subunit C